MDQGEGSTLGQALGGDSHFPIARITLLLLAGLADQDIYHTQQEGYAMEGSGDPEGSSGQPSFM